MNNIEKRHLLVDCDGVLLDPILGFIKWWIFHFPELNLFNILKGSDVFFDEAVFSFFSSNNFQNIPALPQAKNSLELLKRNYKIDVVTSCGDNEYLRSSRIANLERNFGKNFFNEIYTLPYKSSKTIVYNLYNEAVVIDDETKNCLDAAKCGHTVFKLKYKQSLKNLINYDKCDKRTAQTLKACNWKKIINSLDPKQTSR